MVGEIVGEWYSREPGWTRRLGDGEEIGRKGVVGERMIGG